MSVINFHLNTKLNFESIREGDWFVIHSEKTGPMVYIKIDNVQALDVLTGKLNTNISLSQTVYPVQATIDIVATGY